MNSIEIKRQQKLKKNKPKDDNLIENNNNICIDILYQKKMLYFKELQETILPKKENELKILLENKTQNSHFINSKISQLETEIDKIKKKEEENDYYLTTMGLFKDYYDYLYTEDSKKDVQVFGKKNNMQNKKKDYLDKYNNITNKEIVVVSKKKLDSRKKNKGSVSIGADSLKCINENCESFDKIIQTKDAYVCSECGIVQGTIISNTLSFNDSKNHIKIESLDYKRFNYFKEILLQIQGNELTEIPQEIIDKIINELSKENFTDLSKLTIEKTKALLKKTGNSKWYEHTSVIMMRLTNKKPIIIPTPIQEKLFFMFHQIDNNFDKHKFRSSFFSYFYIIHKLLELLDLTEYYKYFPYLDDREKLHFQDTMWKVVVEELKNENGNGKGNFNRFNIDWRYIKST